MYCLWKSWEDCISLYAAVTVVDIESKEDDDYELLEEQGEVDHFCLSNGVEELPKDLRLNFLTIWLRSDYASLSNAINYPNLSYMIVVYIDNSKLSA